MKKMIKFISKFIAKKYVEKHKNDSLQYNLANMSIKSVEFYSDLSLYIVLYFLSVIILIFGLPALVTYLTHSVWYTILTFVVCLTSCVYFTFKLAMNMFEYVKREVNEIIKKRNDKWNDTKWWELKKPVN